MNQEKEYYIGRLIEYTKLVSNKVSQEQYKTDGAKCRLYVTSCLVEGES